MRIIMVHTIILGWYLIIIFIRIILVNHASSDFIVAVMVICNIAFSFLASDQIERSRGVFHVVTLNWFSRGVFSRVDTKLNSQVGRPQILLVN